MKSCRTPALILGLLYACLFSWLAMAASQLPDRVATHFTGSGRSNGWMSRSTHVMFIAGFGLAFPLLVVGVCFATRYAPDSAINVPNRVHWLAPERRSETFAFIFRHSLWFACLAVSFVIGLHGMILQANRQAPSHLSTPLLAGVAGGFLAGVIIWAVILVRHFRRAG